MRMSMKKSMVKAATCLLLAFPTIAPAAESSETRVPPWLVLDFESNTDFTFKRGSDGKAQKNIDQGDATVSAQVLLTKHIKSVITMQLGQEILVDGKRAPIDSTFQHFLDEAFIEIAEVGGQPIAIVVGKSGIPFGAQDYSHMPIFENSSLVDSTDTSHMVIAVKLDFENLFCDSEEFAFYNPEEDVLKPGGMNSLAFRCNKQLSDNINLQVSAKHDSKYTVHEKEEVETSAARTQYSAGIVYDNEIDSAWLQAFFSQNGLAPSAGSLGAVLGVAHRFIKYGKDFGEIAIEGTFLKGNAQLGVGYTYPLTENISVGPELRFIRVTDKESAEDQDLQEGDSAVAGMRLHIEYNIGGEEPTVPLSDEGAGAKGEESGQPAGKDTNRL